MYQSKGNWQRFVEGVDVSDPRYADALAALHYQDPFRAATAPAKVAASQLADLSGQAQAPTLSWPAWDSVSEKAPDAAQRGTYMHEAMQKIDLAQAKTLEGVQAQVYTWLTQGVLTQAQADALDLSLIVRFANSPLAGRILSARQVLREQPFVVRIPARLISPEYPSDETTLLQGILDLAFEEEDGWVLMDYKTDRIPPEGPQALALRYQGQLYAYRLALSHLTGRPVKQALLVLLRTGESIEIAADD